MKKIFFIPVENMRSNPTYVLKPCNDIALTSIRNICEEKIKKKKFNAIPTQHVKTSISVSVVCNFDVLFLTFLYKN